MLFQDDRSRRNAQAARGISHPASLTRGSFAPNQGARGWRDSPNHMFGSNGFGVLIRTTVPAKPLGHQVVTRFRCLWGIPSLSLSRRSSVGRRLFLGKVAARRRDGASGESRDRRRKRRCVDPARRPVSSSCGWRTTARCRAAGCCRAAVSCRAAAAAASLDRQ